VELVVFDGGFTADDHLEGIEVSMADSFVIDEGGVGLDVIVEAKVEPNLVYFEHDMGRLVIEVEVDVVEAQVEAAQLHVGNLGEYFEEGCIERILRVP
jgi:hypothetical protein